ncbi:MAG: aldose 1-epimerase family protein [Actinomycetota bacterium]|nr:aldose 1-epimerase family protein [Actinomycetota bacterium]
MALTGNQYAIGAGDFEATVVEVGGGLRSFAHRGVDIAASYGEGLPPKAAGAILVPWPNRLAGGRFPFDGSQYQTALTEPLTGNAIHGLGRWARWTAVEHGPSSVTMRLDIVAQTGWPFEVSVAVTYSLDRHNGLMVTAAAENKGLGRAPFGMGFHPYLSLGGSTVDEAWLRVPAAERMVVDARQIPAGREPVAGTAYDLRDGAPLGRLRLDDGFTSIEFVGGRGVVEVRTAHGGGRVWFDREFTCVQVYTLDALGEGTAAIAIEPMTCPADAFNSGVGLIVLEPGSGWTASWGIQAR